MYQIQLVATDSGGQIQEMEMMGIQIGPPPVPFFDTVCCCSVATACLLSCNFFVACSFFMFVFLR